MVRKGAMPFAFGTRFFVAIALGLFWIVPAWLAPAGQGWRFGVLMLLWDAAVLGLWWWDLRHLPRPSQLVIKRAWTSPLAIAAHEQVVITIENQSGESIEGTLIDEIPGPLRRIPPVLHAEAGAGKTALVSYDVQPRERGDIRAGRLFFRYQSPFGLAERWAVAELTQKVRVLPALGQAQKFALFLIRSKQIEMEKRRQRHRGRGRDFEGLREYRQGDELRDISWSATARRNQLMTRSFQTERSQTVWLVIDTGRLLRARVRDTGRDFFSSKLDYAVDAALSLAYVATQSGDRAGMLAYGRGVQQMIGPARGPQHLRVLLESLAQVRAESAEADHARAVRALLKAQNRRALIVWLTDFPETAVTPDVVEYAMHLTSRHVVVLAALGQPDLASVARAVPQNEDEMFRNAAALEIVERRELLLRSLRERGVFTLDIDAPGAAASLVNQYLEIKDRNVL